MLYCVFLSVLCTISNLCFVLVKNPLAKISTSGQNSAAGPTNLESSRTSLSATRQHRVLCLLSRWLRQSFCKDLFQKHTEWVTAACWLDITLCQTVDSRPRNDKFLLSQIVQNSLSHSVCLFCPSTYLGTVGDLSCTSNKNRI